MTQIQTCSAALLYAGQCCGDGCSQPADVAVLDAAMVEHAMCYVCALFVPDQLGAKPLKWDGVWKP